MESTHAAPRITQTVEMLLRNPRSLLAMIREGADDGRELTLQLIVLSALGFGAFGFVVGLTHSAWMGLLAAPKLIFVGLGSFVVCLPALYVYGRFLGNRSSVQAVVGEALTAIATAGMTLLALCPVLLVYQQLAARTLGGYLYSVIGAAVLISFACLRGISVLLSAFREAGRPVLHLFAWTLLFGLVGMQCAWIVRPFVGTPTGELTLLRPLERTAFDSVYRTTTSAIETAFSPRQAPSGPRRHGYNLWFEGS